MAVGSSVRACAGKSKIFFLLCGLDGELMQSCGSLSKFRESELATYAVAPGMHSVLARVVGLGNRCHLAPLVVHMSKAPSSVDREQRFP